MRNSNNSVVADRRFRKKIRKRRFFAKKYKKYAKEIYFFQ